MSSETDLGALLLAILENVGFAVAVIDAQGNIAFANKKALTMWGEHSVVQGTAFLEWRSAYRIEDSQGREIPAEKALVFRVLAGENALSQDFKVILPDGSGKWVHVISQRFTVFGITGILAVVADETEQVQLHRAMERLQQIESLGQLARGLIHDLNNMFSVVSENLKAARADNALSDSTRQHLVQTSLALDKGITLTKRLGQFSRTQELRTQPSSINRSVNTALELTRPLFGNQIRVKLALDDNLPMVEVDPGAIEQVLVNLILNAAEAMPNGGEISLSTELVKREAASRSGEGPAWFILITIVDTGVGIPKDIQSKIFEPFFTTKAERRGTGLGLASVFGIVKHHQGEVTVDSAPGRGSRFAIYLPVTTSEDFLSSNNSRFQPR